MSFWIIQVWKYKIDLSFRSIQAHSWKLLVVQGPREGQILMDRPVNDDFNRYQIQQNQMGIPVAISNEQPFAMEVIDPLSLETVKSRLTNFLKKASQNHFRRGSRVLANPRNRPF